MRAKKAFTLVEFVLALVLMSVLGLSVAGVAKSVSDGYAASEGYGDAIQCGRYTTRLLQSTAHQARLIVASSSTAVAFWAQDRNDDGKINLDELTLVTYDSNKQEIQKVAVVFPDGLYNKGSLNVVKPLSAVTSVSAVASVLSASSYCGTSVLASDVSSFNVTVSPAAPLAKRVNVELRLGAGPEKLSLSASASLRADKTANAGLVNNLWTLTP